MEIDHLVIFTRTGAPAAGRLVEMGLREGSSRRHAGQGTANRRFFFANAMLELLWIDDEVEARDPARAALRLWERRPGGGGCPLGVCFRPSAPGETPPFPTRPYRPPFLPAPLAIDVASDAPPDEPLWFFLGFARRPGAGGEHSGEPRDHPAGVRQLTGIRLTLPGAQQLSLPARAAAAAGVWIERGRQSRMALTFDDGGRRRVDLAPDLPLVLSW